jgi:Ca-activated chloride channel family protein
MQPLSPPRLALVATLLLGALAASPKVARADGFLVPTQPNRPVRGEWAVSDHKVSIAVHGPQARVTVDEEFVNLSGGTLEAEYVFPLPAGAMVSSITLLENGRGLEGRLLRAEDARRAYEEIVRRQRDPALLEYLGRDIFRVRVFPIPAGDRRRVVLQYDQLLQTDAGLTELLYPLNTEKFSARPLDQVVVTVDLESDTPLGPIYSPTHDVAIARPDAKHAQVSFEAKGVKPDTDFLLYWSTTQGPIGATLLTYWPREDDRGYFLFLASPSLADGEARAARPKEITLVVDVSGAMAGEKIEQVKAALRQVIGGLNDGDRFNLIAYHTAVLPLWDAPRGATPDNRREALAYVDQIKAQGGTNIEAALAAALSAKPSDIDGASVILFLTDGRPTVGVTDPDEILRRAAEANRTRRTKIFVFGVGVDLNSVLLDRLALENHGAPSFVQPKEDVERKVASLYEKIRYPVLTDMRFRMAGVRATEVLPGAVPDLFRGGEVILAGRYDHGGRVETVLSGDDGNVGREFHYLLSAADRGGGLSSDFPARVWATRRIAELLDQIRLKKSQDKELVDEIVRLSTRFGILTEYTAFLADDTVSLTDTTRNVARAREEIDALKDQEVGGVSWAQSRNQQERRAAPRPPEAAPRAGAHAAGGSGGGGGGQAFFKGDSDGRTVTYEVVRGVRQVANRAFYLKSGTWVDEQVAGTPKVDEEVVRWSPRFFEILQTTTQDENTRLSQSGTLLLEVQGRVLRVVDPG